MITHHSESCWNSFLSMYKYLHILGANEEVLPNKDNYFKKQKKYITNIKTCRDADNVNIKDNVPSLVPHLVYCQWVSSQFAT